MRHVVTRSLQALTSLILFAGAANAAGPGDFAGTFTYVGGTAEKATVSTAVEKAAQEFNPLIRPFARPKLEKAARVPSTIEITWKAPEMGIRQAPLPARVTPVDGKPATLKTTVGTTTITRRIEQNSLVEVAKTEDGERTSTYVLSDGGKTLTLNAAIASNKLKNAIRYTLTFKRVGG